MKGLRFRVEDNLKAGKHIPGCTPTTFIAVLDRQVICQRPHSSAHVAFHGAEGEVLEVRDGAVHQESVDLGSPKSTVDADFPLFILISWPDI